MYICITHYYVMYSVHVYIPSSLSFTHSEGMILSLCDQLNTTPKTGNTLRTLPRYSDRPCTYYNAHATIVLEYLYTTPTQLIKTTPTTPEGVERTGEVVKLQCQREDL